jgi:hypothetical protein
VAARIERELHVDVEKIKGRYGEYKILVDGEIIINGGAKALLGILPSGKKVVEAVKTRLNKVACGGAD